MERSLLQLFMETPSHAEAVNFILYQEIDPEKDDIQWLDLTDNRDFKVMTSWDPTDK